MTVVVQVVHENQVYQYASSDLEQVLDKFDAFEGNVEKIRNDDLDALRPGKSLQTISEFKPRQTGRRSSPVPAQTQQQFPKQMPPSKRSRQDAFGGSSSNMVLQANLPLATSAPFSMSSHKISNDGTNMLAEQIRRQNFHLAIPPASTGLQQHQSQQRPNEMYPAAQVQMRHSKENLTFDSMSHSPPPPSGPNVQLMSRSFAPAEGFQSFRSTSGDSGGAPSQRLPVATVNTPNMPQAQHMWSPVPSRTGSNGATTIAVVPSWSTITPQPQQTVLGFSPTIVGAK